MKKLLYFDCIGGAAGDMILASLISLGVPDSEIRKGLSSFAVEGYEIRTWKEQRSGIEGLRLRVDQVSNQPSRHFSDIKKILNDSDLPHGVRDRSLAVFSRLADAEAKVHGIPVDKVHFHEVGAVDSIVDIVGSVLALHYLEIDTIQVSPLPMGHGLVKTAHGMLPLPAPATLELLRDTPVYGVDIKGELVTPTAAAFLTTVADTFGHLPSMKPERIGYGLGTAEWKDRPNVVRVVQGVVESVETEHVDVLECNVDDMNPEFYGPIMERLFTLGALDVTLVPVYMKKNRPGTLIHVLIKPGDKSKAIDFILAETTTIGLRHYPVQRCVLPRRVITIATPFGSARVKEVTRPDGSRQYAPEFEDVKRFSEQTGKPLKEIYRLIEAAATDPEIP